MLVRAHEQNAKQKTVLKINMRKLQMLISPPGQQLIANVELIIVNQ